MRKLRRLFQEIELANRRHRLFRRGDRLLLAVSGGPDSTALAWLLKKLERKYRLRLAVAHLDHGLLPAQGRRHASFVEDLSARLGIPFYSKKIRLRPLAKKAGRSLEETGRIERYDFFEKTAAKIRADKIVTAHTLDDQAETVLMRILRGAGLRGLSGIPFKRRLGRAEVVRPLLGSRKKDLLGFLKELHEPFCVDRTNRDPFFTRNRVRHRLLPEIARRFNPQIREALAGLQEVSFRVQEYLDSVSERAFRRCLESASPKRIVLSVRRLRRLPEAVRSEVILRALAKRKGDTKRLTRSHLTAIFDILDSPERRLELSLPNRVRVRKEDLWLTLS